MIHISDKDPMINLGLVANGDIWVVDNNINININSINKSCYKHNSVYVLSQTWKLFFDGSVFIPGVIISNGNTNNYPIFGMTYKSNVSNLSVSLASCSTTLQKDDIIICFDQDSKGLTIQKWDGNKGIEQYPIHSLSNVIVTAGPQTSSPPSNTGTVGQSIGHGMIQNANVTKTPKSLITIHDPSGNLLVDIDLYGGITYGSTYTPDATAQQFWASISNNSPIVLQNQLKQIQQQIINAQMQQAINAGGVSVSSSPMQKGSTTNTGSTQSGQNDYDRAMKILG